MSHPVATSRFCPSCGSPHVPEARFCGNCGAAFSSAPQPPPLPSKDRARQASGGWKVAVGDRLPSAATFFPEVGKKVRLKRKKSASGKAAAAGNAVGRAKPIIGSTLAMAVTQGADLVTRTMQSGVGGDPQMQLRLAIAAAIAVFGLFLGPMPKLRMILVRLGTVLLALLQGGSLVSVLGGLATDPQLLSIMAPNLGAQAASLLAIFRLFKVAGRS